MPSSSKKSHSRKPHSNVLLAVVTSIFLFLGLIGILRVLGLHFFIDSRAQWRVAPAATIDGTIHFSAIQPDPKSAGKVMLLVQRQGETVWHNPDIGIPLEQNARWSWSEALPGVHYNLQAVLIMDGQELKKSEVVMATAPAVGVEIPLELNWKDLPMSADTTKLGGQVTVNGFIPNGSRVEIYALAPQFYEDQVFQITTSVLQRSRLLDTVANPQASVKWEWNLAVPREEYFIAAVLRNASGNIIGVAEEFVLADASEVDLEQTINSTAPPPAAFQQTSVLGVQTTLADATLAQTAATPTAGNASITGTVTIQGPLQKGTSLLMLWRKPGDQQYQVINRYQYPTQQGTAWQFPGAVVGQQYEIMAVLQVNGNNSSTAPNPLTVTAPATNVTFNLNTYYVMPTTSQAPVNEVCINKDSSGSTAVIRLPQMPNATQYWLQVGTSPSQAGVYNQKMPADDQDLKVQVRVTNNQQNYMRYSYATCTNCSSDDNFAPYSATVGFTCS